MSRSPPVQPPKVLVVDADPARRQALAQLLQADGLAVHQAGTAATALALLRRHHIALALLTVAGKTPVAPATGPAQQEGDALAQRMRADVALCAVPILLLVAGGPLRWPPFADDGAGTVDQLAHPVDAVQLRHKVRLLLGLHRQRHQMAYRLAQLERLSQVHAMMLGALSHEIRTPLAAIALNAELLRRGKQAGPGLDIDQVGQRIKAATVILGRQVDHLANVANLANRPLDDPLPEPMPLDLGQLVRQRLRWCAAQNPAPAATPAATAATTLVVDGDPHGQFDPAMLADAVDTLLLAACQHADGQVVAVLVDGLLRRSLALRVQCATVLPEPVRRQLLGAGAMTPETPPQGLGPGLQGAGRVARAHGGSLIAHSRAGEGTVFELMLPRGRA